MHANTVDKTYGLVQGPDDVMGDLEGDFEERVKMSSHVIDS